MLNLPVWLVMAAVSAGFGLAFFNLFPDMALEAILAGITAFVALFSLLCVLNAASVKRRIASLEAGIHQAETNINRRINDISNGTVDRDELEMLRARVSSLQSSVKPTKSRASVKPESVTGSTAPVHKDDSIAAAAIVKHANGSANGHATQTYSNIAIGEAEREKLHLHLQPIVDVASRSTLGFQIVPTKRNHDEQISHLDNADSPQLEDVLQKSRRELQIFSKSMQLVRKLRQKAPDVLVFIPFSGSVFADKNSYKQLKKEVEANKALAKHCVLCIDAAVWQQVEKSKRAYLVDLLDCGFQTALVNCADPSSLKKSVKLDQFSFYFASVADLGIDASEQSNGSAAILQQLSRQHGFEIIVASVDHDYELIRLVDEDFAFAIGEYLSPARAPNL